MAAERLTGDFTPQMAISGAVLGVTAFVLGLVFTVFTAGGPAQQAAGAFEPLAAAGGRFVPAWKAAGWTFLDGHFVGTTYPGGSVDMVGMASAQYVYLVPVLLLLVAGGALGALLGSPEPRTGMLRGIALVVGYLPMAVVFALILQHANVQPSLLRAAVVAGLVYPIAFGAIGGVFGTRLRTGR